MPGSPDSAHALLAALTASLPAALATNQADQPHTAHWQARDLDRLADFSPTHLLYLHGFRSSAQSAKARCMAAWVSEQRPDLQWHCPTLSPSPDEAIARVQAWLADVPPGRCAIMGSSLGGFYAAWLARHWDLPAVLINPAVHPARDLARHIGEQRGWHDPQSRFFFEPAFIAQLQALEVGALTAAQRLLVFIAQGDEVLDWQEMRARYPGAQQVIREGGDHAWGDFAQWLPQVGSFLGWPWL